MSKGGSRLSRVGVLAPAALSACIDASVLAAPAAGAILSTVLKELSKAFMLKNWFHGVMSSQEAEHLLLQKGKHGSYLVRESRAHPGQYVLSVRVRTRVAHVIIRREQNKYDVGSGETFDDLAGVIEHCRAYPLREASGEALRLRQPVSGARPSSKHIPDKDNNKIFVNGRIMQNFEEDHGLLHSDDMDNPYVLEYEFVKSFDREGVFTKLQGCQEVNQYKNRYRDILPFDQTRVPLPLTCYTLDEGSTDYINASYIRPDWMYAKLEPGLAGIAQPVRTSHSSDWEEANARRPATGRQPNPFATGGPVAEMRAWDQGHNKFYIATQGCLATTRHAFWTMIADNDVRVIAMLTQCVENGTVKSDQYWPAVGMTEALGEMRVTTLGEYEHAHYTARDILLSMGCKHTKIYHYQYREWADHQVPDDEVALNVYVRDVNDRMRLVARDNDAPRHNILCVQCSAGIGRTGTYIAVDMLTDYIKKVGARNFAMCSEIPDVVRVLRRQRPGMVHNVDQYKFIYSAIVDYITNKTGEPPVMHYGF